MHHPILHKTDMSGKLGFWDNFNMQRSEVDWCEQNYAITEYVAEFFNTISAVGMLSCGLLGIYFHYNLEKRIKLMFFTILVVGLVSQE
jgi:hypothetical protein